MKKESETLNRLENDDWGEPPADAPPSMKRCFGLRNKNLRDMDVEDIRLLIGQDIGLSYLMPIAVKLLKGDPLIHGQHYPGDLLVSVLRADRAYFRSNPDTEQAIMEIVSKELAKRMEELDHVDYDCANEAISEALNDFKG